MAVSRSTARKLAQREWNAKADQFNQWPELDADEKKKLIETMMRRMGAAI